MNLEELKKKTENIKNIIAEGFVGGIKKTEDGIISSNSDVFTTKTADKLNNLQNFLHFCEILIF